MVSVILTTVQEHDDLWFELAIGHLNVSRADLQNYIAHGDSVLLANCIHTIRFMVSDYTMHGWARHASLRSKTLESVSKFEVRQTLPGLQHAFCLVWNEVVLLAKNARSRDTHFMWVLILRHIRNIYIELHQGTNAAPTAFSASTCTEDGILGDAWSYPFCNIGSHHPANSQSSSGLPVRRPISAPFYGSPHEPDIYYGLRNEIALRARSGESYHSRLDSINTLRNIYIALPWDIEAAPAAIPICTAGSDLIPPFHPPAEPGVPSTSTQNPNHASTYSAEALPHGDIPAAPQHLVLVATFSPPATLATRISPVDIEGHRLCTTSLDLATVDATQGVPHILAISSEPVLRTYPIRAFFESRSILPRPPLAASSSHGDSLAPKQNEDPTIPLPTLLVHCVCLCQLRPSAMHSPQIHL
ncbi:hypothetical protein BJV78DRAFT_1253830 [Lactifluus subvellereus]|nr:hypothetical protein BJV78DRAFT_1253830 [Lactifluus subvellereus]